METRLVQYNNKCIPASLGQVILFRISSIQLDKSDSKEDPRRMDISSNHCDTQMATSALVSTASKNVCTNTISLSSGKRFVSKSTLVKPPSSRNKAIEISSVEGFWKSFNAVSMLSRWSHIQGGKAQELIMNYPGACGLTSVIKYKLTLFKCLWLTLLVSCQKNLIKYYSLEPRFL